MKTKLCIWIGLIAFTVGAATLTIDIPANDIPRVSAAYGAMLGLGRSATVTEVQDAVRLDIISNVYGYEGTVHSRTYSPTPLAMMPTPTPTFTPTPTPTPTP
jgi:hypothetical protein